MKLCYDAFSIMKNLKMLHISPNDNDKDHGLLGLMKWNGDSLELKLSNELCIMEWSGYPLCSLPDGPSFELIDLAELSLRHSHIVQLWNGNKDFLRLKHIDLSFSKRLIKIPNLAGVSNLEILNLSFCEELDTLIDSSIENLEKLRKLFLQGCCKLRELPKRLSSKSLEVLDLSKCSNLRRFPDVSCSSRRVRNLDISGTAMEEFPSLLAGFSSLESFHAYGIKELSVLCCALNTTFQLFTFSALSSLEVLKLCHCSILDEATPLDFSGLSSLKYLDLSHNIFTKLPNSICEASNLHQLVLDDCSELKELSETLFLSLRSLSKLSLSNCNLSDSSIPKSISCWSSISSLNLSKNKFIEISDNICELSNLHKLILDGCISLRTLPKLPLSLHSLHLRDCPLGDTFGSQRTTDISRDMLRTNFCFSTVVYVSFGRPHTILDLHSQSPPYTDDREHLIEPRIVCGRTRGSEIPDGFITGRFSSKKEAQFHMFWKSENDGPSACALSIVYKDTRESKKRKFNELESSNFGACEDNDHIFPEFVCQLQLNETSPEQNRQLACQSQPNEWSPASSIIRVPEVVYPGSSYRVWVFIVIPDSIREPKHKKGNISDSSQKSEAMEGWSYSASVTACSENVELEDCRARLLGVDGTGLLSQFVRSICPSDLGEQNLKAALDVLLVTGPIVSSILVGSPESMLW